MTKQAFVTSVQPLAVSKLDAASMLSISPNTFSKLVGDGSMPSARCIGSRRVWIVSELMVCAAALPSVDEIDTWADI